jgi:hypothetical protein
MLWINGDYSEIAKDVVGKGDAMGVDTFGETVTEIHVLAEEVVVDEVNVPW